LMGETWGAELLGACGGLVAYLTTAAEGRESPWFAPVLTGQLRKARPRRRNWLWPLRGPPPAPEGEGGVRVPPSLVGQRLGDEAGTRR